MREIKNLPVVLYPGQILKVCVWSLGKIILTLMLHRDVTIFHKPPFYFDNLSLSFIIKHFNNILTSFMYFSSSIK